MKPVSPVWMPTKNTRFMSLPFAASDKGRRDASLGTKSQAGEDAEFTLNETLVRRNPAGQRVFGALWDVLAQLGTFTHAKAPEAAALFEAATSAGEQVENELDRFHEGTEAWARQEQRRIEKAAQPPPASPDPMASPPKPVGPLDKQDREDALFLRNTTHVSVGERRMAVRIAPENRVKTVSFDVPTLEKLQKLRGTYTFRVPLAPGADLRIQPARIANARLDSNLPRVREQLGKTLGTDSLMENEVKWPNGRLIRDLHQNNFDGHGGTLEGVTLTVRRARLKDPYEVRIRGLGMFPYTYVLLKGASGKRKLQTTAGQFGEATKEIPRIMLRRGLAETFEYRSANWSLAYSGALNEVGRPELHYTLNELPADQAIDGNELVFTTRDAGFIRQLIQGVKLFRHPQHPDFANPTAGTAEVGVKLLKDPNRPGHVYIAGQRFQVTDDITGHASFNHGLKGLNLWLDKRPEGIGRDRASLSLDEVHDLVLVPVLHRLKDAEIMGLLFRMRRQWSVDPSDMRAEADGEEKPHQSLKRKDPLQVSTEAPFLQALVYEARRRNLHTPFPPQYVATSTLSPSEAELLAASGKVPCYPVFEALGMNGSVLNTIPDGIRLVTPQREDYTKMRILQTASRLIAMEGFNGGNAKGPVPVEPLKAAIRLFDADPYQPAHALPTVFVHPKTGEIWWHAADLRKMPLSQALSMHLTETFRDDQGGLREVLKISTRDWTQMVSQRMFTPETYHSMHTMSQVWDSTTRSLENAAFFQNAQGPASGVASRTAVLPDEDDDASYAQAAQMTEEELEAVVREQQRAAGLKPGKIENEDVETVEDEEAEADDGDFSDLDPDQLHRLNESFRMMLGLPEPPMPPGESEPPDTKGGKPKRPPKK